MRDDEEEEGEAKKGDEEIPAVRFWLLVLLLPVLIDRRTLLPFPFPRWSNTGPSANEPKTGELEHTLLPPRIHMHRREGGKHKCRKATLFSGRPLSFPPPSRGTVFNRLYVVRMVGFSRSPFFLLPPFYCEGPILNLSLLLFCFK